MVSSISARAFLAGTLSLCSFLQALGDANSKPDNARDFRLQYGGSITDLAPNDDVRVWIPVPHSDKHQSAQIVGWQLPKAAVRRTKDKVYGNEMLYMEFPAQSTTEDFRVDFEVTRHEVNALKSTDAKLVPLTKAMRAQFLRSNARVPISGKPLALLPSFKPNWDVAGRARAIYDRVDSHVAYDKTRPGYGFGDVLWVCDSRTGNCTDFHSLFISMARSQSIPARFEIGFSIRLS